MEQVLGKLAKEIIDYNKTVDSLPLIPSVSAHDIRDYLKTKYKFESPIPLDKLTDDVCSMMRHWTMHTNNHRYFGLYVPGTMLSSTIADALVALYNPQLGVWSHAPAACEIERYTLQFFMKKYGMDEHSGCANFTTGGTEANLSAVLTALIKYFPEYGDKGLRALSKQPVFYVSEEAHHSFMKISQITGLGYNAVRKVPTDDEFIMDMSKLQELYSNDIKNGSAPFMVVGTAGTTSAGTIDPLPAIAEFCLEHDLWFHADAAYGGAAIVSRKLKSALSGIEKADSITCDAHKWLSVSMSAGMFFSRHKKYVAEAFHAGAAYLPDTIKDTIDAYNTTIQCSRRFVGLKLFMSLSELGEAGYSDFIERQAELGVLLRHNLQQAGIEVVNNTPLPVVCFTHERIKSGEISVRGVLEKLYDGKEFWISGTKLKNKIPVFRACVTSLRTNEKDIEALVTNLDSAIKNTNSLTCTAQ